MSSAYYNENDAYAAGWLRNLVAAGHLPAGTVDERSILDVEPGDLDGYDECHFFAGIGGWPYALRLAGWHGPVWTGSCPCQPLSSAGQRKGHADSRHLWPAFYALIAECRPATVFGEQVAGADGREWLAGVRADLEGAGYAVGAADLCAAGAGAPHIRQRLFWVADAANRRHQPLEGVGRVCGAEVDDIAISEPRIDGDAGGLADAAERGRLGSREDHAKHAAPGPLGSSNTQYDRLAGEGRTLEDPAGGLADADGQSGQSGLPATEWQKPLNDSATGGLADADGTNGWGATATPKTESDGHRNYGGLGDTAPIGWREERPLANGSDARDRAQGSAERSGAGFWADAVWLACLDSKSRRTQPGIQPLAHGVPARVGRLRAYGNAIVPQAAAAFVTAFMETRG